VTSVIPIGTDANGAGDRFGRPMDADDPASASAFTSEDNLDAERSQERLRAPQAAGQRAGIFGPAGATPRDAVVAAIGAHTQQVGGAAPPGAALGHELAHAGGQRVGVDGILESTLICTMYQ
jgi:hypothetical protein